MASGKNVRQTRFHQPVFDILNCGPRNRFTICGSDGRSFIVHNCTQAVARDVMAENLPAIDSKGYKCLLTIHDETITETPDNTDFSEKELSKLLATNPIWAKDMPLAASGFETKRYKKE